MLRFCQTGNGVQCLGEGWNRPEGFGAWACDYRAAVRLPVPPSAAPQGRLRIEIAARGPIPREDFRFFYAIHVPRARVAISQEFSAQRGSGVDVIELDIADLGEDDGFEVAFRCVDLVNPALHDGADNRPLGLGLESITISALPARGEGGAP